MKITPKILSIPPYLSTSWPQVRSIYIQDANMVVSLLDGAVITIPGLSKDQTDTVFAAHTTFLEGLQNRHPNTHERQAPVHIFQALSNNSPFIPPHPPGSDGEGIASLRFSFDNMDSLCSAMQHNQVQAHLPDLPKEILNKIAAIAKIVSPDDIQNMPKAEPHCNCPHCQIARAVHSKAEIDHSKDSIPILENKDEEVSAEELTFQQWNITQTGEKLFTVTNRLDLQEQYSVFLGNPVGCTCGNPGCEHIVAVLKS